MGCAYIGLGLSLWTVAAGFGYMAITESSGGGFLVAIVCLFLGGTCLAQSMNPDTWEGSSQAVEQQSGRYPWDTKSPDVDDSRIYTDPAFGSRQRVEYQSPAEQSARKHKDDPCWRPEDFNVPPCQNCNPKSRAKQEPAGYTRQEWAEHKQEPKRGLFSNLFSNDGGLTARVEENFAKFQTKWQGQPANRIRVEGMKKYHPDKHLTNKKYYHEMSARINAWADALDSQKKQRGRRW
jgi:hypothetical protein